eukprot:jgi/Botrbrau1/5457/Bobra.27_1s0008.1
MRWIQSIETSMRLPAYVRRYAKSAAKQRREALAAWVIRDPDANNPDALAAGTPQLPRFYVQPQDLVKCQQGSVLELNTEETHHALRVLRLKEREGVEICDGEGHIAHGVLSGMSAKNRAWVRVEAPLQKVEWRGPKWEVVAASGSLKGGRSEWLIEKAVELGAFSFRPLMSRRSPHLGRMKVKVRVGKLDEESSQDEEAFYDMSSGRLTRWERVALAAVKQSLRAHSLKFQAPVRVHHMGDLVQHSPLALVAVQGAPPLYEVLGGEEQALEAAAEAGAGPALLMVGPEGDFTRGELGVLLEAGARPVGLGPHRLRVETAALALLNSASMFVHGRDGRVPPNSASGP